MPRCDVTLRMFASLTFSNLIPGCANTARNAGRGTRPLICAGVSEEAALAGLASLQPRGYNKT